VRATPADAVLTKTSARHCVQVSCSRRNTSPGRAAAAGSRLIKMPKVRLESTRSVIISKVNSTALEKKRDGQTRREQPRPLM